MKTSWQILEENLKNEQKCTVILKGGEEEIKVHIEEWQSKTSWNYLGVMIEKDKKTKMFALSDRRGDETQWIIQEPKTELERELHRQIMSLIVREGQEALEPEATERQMESIRITTKEVDYTEGMCEHLLIMYQEKKKAKKQMASELDALLGGAE